MTTNDSRIDTIKNSEAVSLTVFNRTIEGEQKVTILMSNASRWRIWVANKLLWLAYKIVLWNDDYFGFLSTGNKQ